MSAAREEFAPGKSSADIIAEAIPSIDELRKDQGIQVEIRWVQVHIGV